MPRVTIRTGFVAADGREEQLSEFLCDAPGCANVATEAIGCIKECGVTVVLCGEHAAALRAPQAVRKPPRAVSGT